MIDTSVLAGLFFSALTSATLLPGSSEAVLLALLASGHDATALVIAATVGNVAGSLINWLLGRGIARFKDKPWFPVDARSYASAEAWYARYGRWSLLFAWVPIIGDPLTVVAGALRVDLRWFLVLVTLGKVGRYAAIAASFLWVTR